MAETFTSAQLDPDGSVLLATNRRIYVLTLLWGDWELR